MISIITPSFRNSDWLKLCIASVADQTGITVEHIVQDACSDDGTLDWLPKDPRVQAYVEKDAGMYDAINRGLRKARGEILAYLNCDEQYLPGALNMVHDFFSAHPAVEVVFGDTVVVDATGQFIAYRKTVVPFKPHVMTCHLPVFTCATFFRRTVLDRHGVWFNPRWRDVGDADWIIRLLEKKVPMAVLLHYTSAFTQTGQNMNFLPNAIREKLRLRAAAPLWMRATRIVWMGQHRLRKWKHGCYRQTPFHYSIYTLDNVKQRTRFEVTSPEFRL